MDSMIIVMFVGLLVVGVGLLMIVSLGRRGRSQLNKEAYQKDWLSIEGSVGADSASQQFAIFQADKLLDRALRESGFAGETMGERMKSAHAVFTKRDAVWTAHKLRNRIAHEDKVSINPRLTRQALASFKRALRDMGAI
ncbi:MAG: hypothetical protein WBB39_01310 [Candidatus Saccharimonadales bacterium]